MLKADEYTQLVTARLFDFFNRHGSWHISLWGIGTALAVEEVAEYSDLTRAGAFPSKDGLKYVAASTRRLIEADEGVGAREVRTTLLTALGEREAESEAGAETLRYLASRLRHRYLVRLADTTRRGNADRPGVEYVSSAAASYLLDAGFSDAFLHDWLRARVKEDAREYDIGEILEQADDLVAAEPREFEVVVPFAALPGGYPGSMPDEWMDSEATATWVDSADPPIEGDVRQAGAVQIRTRACDPWSAVEAASEVVNQAVARVALSARYGRLRSKNFGWVRGYAQVFPLRRQTRVQLRSLKTADQVFRVARSDADAAIDDALEIFSALGAGTRGASLTGGWAAVEGLLLRRTESPHVRAADRLAAIVACAFPRAELTTLSYRHTARPADDLAQALGAAVTNLERCEALERAMRAGCPPVVVRPSDRAMLRRVEGMLNAPQEKLGNVKRYVEETMRRLYTQRNLIMHAGSFQSVTLRATLRTAPRLVAAGVDRIVDARLSDGAEPLALAARAEVELGLLGSLGSGPLARLLA